MGYEIRYGPKEPVPRKNFSRAAIAAVLILALLFGVRALWPDGAARAAALFFPADAREAFRQMVETIQAGEKVGDALTAFCREVIENAELPNGA